MKNSGRRHRIVEALLFALEYREAPHGMIAKAASRPAARRRLIREGGLSAAQADAVLDLRWWQSTRAVQQEFGVELQDLLHRESGSSGGFRQG